MTGFRNLNDNDIGLIVSLYRKGKSVRDVGAITKIGYDTIHKVVRLAGIVRQKPTLEKATIKRVRELYALKIKPRFIARELGVTPKQVMNICSRGRTVKPGRGTDV